MINKTKFFIIFLLTFIFIGFTGCQQTPTDTEPEDPYTPGHVISNLQVPTNLTVTIIDDKIEFSFDFVENAVTYSVVVSSSDGKQVFSEKISSDFNKLVILASRLENGTYSAKVRANGDDGVKYYNSQYSSPVMFTVTSNVVTPEPLVVLKAPQNITLTNNTETFTVSYGKITNASGYRIVVKDSNGEVAITKDVEADVLSQEITCSTLKDGEYTVAIIALGDNEKYTDSAESQEELFKVKSGKPDTGQEEPPVELMAYYKQAEGLTGSALKAKLRSIITSTHKKVTSYADCKTYLQNADEDPNNSSNMLLYYTGTSVKKSDNMNIWNREHVWAKSLGWFENSGAGADLHHIRPCNPSVNSSRGNKKFGTGSGYYNPFNVNNSGQDYRGDTARIIFYLFTRYSESDRYSFTSIAQSLDILLQWNELDPVNAQELHRNDYIYTIQGNRNPFIDYPEFADMIWG